MNEDSGQSDMAEGERQVLAREQALKASSGGSSHTTYSYATGPDGRSYIVSAEVTITAPEEVLDAIPGGTKTLQSSGTAQAQIGKADDNKNSGKTEDDTAVSAEVAKLKQTERDVVAHEAAHKAAAGSFGGAVSYTYTTGPDGKKYITGGEVPISTPATSDPEEALRNANQVARAALAPGDPSGQDIAVAASAAQMAANARAQIASRGSDKSGQGGRSPAGSPEADSAGKASPENEDTIVKSSSAMFSRAASAYSRQTSPKGFWTAEKGYESSGTGRESGVQESGSKSAPAAPRYDDIWSIAGRREIDIAA
jgi:hypothetical protein